MEIAVIGMGYVGIPIAALLADVEGFKVTGVQRRSKRSGWKIERLNAGESPIGGEEPELAELIQRVVRKGSFKVVEDTSTCEKADVILVDVQTPVDENHVPQYESLKEAVRDVGKHLKSGAMVIIESTVAPGTTVNVVKPILERSSSMKAGKNFNLVFSYERVTVGRLLHNLKYMPRIVGGFTLQCAERGVAFYRNFVKADIFSTDCLTAEVAKVVENTYRDVNIAFANETALICESIGVNIHDVRRFVNSLPHDPSNPAKNPYRMMHLPGAGVGGHCLPKDSWLLLFGLKKYGHFKFRPHVITESREINDFMPCHMRDLIEEVLKDKGIKLQDSKICILGFAFLENSDDTRNTPALPLYTVLREQCKEVIVHDPYVREFENVAIVNDLEKALRDKDCMVVVTRHREYMKISLSWLKRLLRTPVIVDGRNIFSPNECAKAGFSFRGVGIGKSDSAA